MRIVCARGNRWSPEGETRPRPSSSSSSSKGCFLALANLDTTGPVPSRRPNIGSHSPAQRTVEDDDENEYGNSVIRAESFLLRVPLRTARITKGHQRDGSDTG